MTMQTNAASYRARERSAAYEGMPIRSAEPSPRRGILGACLSWEGRLLGITSAHLFSTDDRVLDESGSLLVGHRKAMAGTAQAPRQIGDYKSVDLAVAMITLDKNVHISASSIPAVVARSPEDPSGFLSRQVKRIRRDGSIANGVLTGLDMPFAVRSRTGKLDQYFGGLEISWASDVACFAAPGEAGSLVYSVDGGPLGIVIGGTGGRCYAAPLNGLFLRSDIKFADSADVRAHNERAYDLKNEALDPDMDGEWPIVEEFTQLMLRTRK
jgi:hypothetical protein